MLVCSHAPRGSTGRDRSRASPHQRAMQHSGAAWLQCSPGTGASCVPARPMPAALCGAAVGALPAPPRAHVFAHAVYAAMSCAAASDVASSRRPPPNAAHHAGATCAPASGAPCGAPAWADVFPRPCAPPSPLPCAPPSPLPCAPPSPLPCAPSPLPCASLRSWPSPLPCTPPSPLPCAPSPLPCRRSSAAACSRLRHDGRPRRSSAARAVRLPRASKAPNASTRLLMLARPARRSDASRPSRRAAAAGAFR
eukprot:5690802-Prymnesium_polylepis.1